MSGWSASSERVDAVLFDLGNTLVAYYRAADFPPVLERCVAAAAAVLNEQPKLRRADATAALEQALAANVERDDYRVRPLAERLIEVFRLDSRLVPEGLLTRAGAAFLGPIFATARLDGAAVQMLEQIKQLGIKTAIVSNTPWGSPAAAWRAELARHGLLDRLDAAVFCVDVGWRKPAVQPFVRALELLGVSPERAWFVGDDPIWDVAGARGAGLRPVLLGPRLPVEPEQFGCIATLSDLVPLLKQYNALSGSSRGA